MEGKPPLRRGKRQRGSGLEGAHAIGQQPQGAVQANVRINALHGAGLLSAAIGGAAMQSALGQVLLRAVEHAPQVGAAVVEAARHQDLRFRNGRGLVRVVVLEGQRGAGEHFRFPSIQGDGLHGFARCLRMLEAAHYLIGALDDMARHVAFVGHAHIAHGVSADKAIAAHEAEHAAQQLIAARAVVRVQQDDFVGFAGADLVGVAQAQHVFRVLAPALVANAGLAHHEGLKPLFAKLGQHGGGGDVAVPLGTAFMGGLREDGRGHAADLGIGQRGVAAQCGGVVSEAGCELHGLSPEQKGC